MPLSTPNKPSANSTLHQHTTSLSAVKGKTPDLSPLLLSKRLKAKPPEVPKLLQCLGHILRHGRAASRLPHTMEGAMPEAQCSH